MTAQHSDGSEDESPAGLSDEEEPKRYAVRFMGPARRALSESLPESVAAAVIEFCDAALTANPYRVGKPLFGPFAGCYGARRGTYRIIYRIDDGRSIVHVLDVEHRSEAYRPR